MKEGFYQLNYCRGYIFKKCFFTNILATKFVIDGYIGRVNESLNSAQWAYDILTECTVNFRKGIS